MHGVYPQRFTEVVQAIGFNVFQSNEIKPVDSKGSQTQRCLRNMFGPQMSLNKASEY